MSSDSTLYLRGRVSTSLIASMLTSLGSTANSDVTYMMMDFLSGNCTATSERVGARRWRRGRCVKERSEIQVNAGWKVIAVKGERRRLDGKGGGGRMRQVMLL